MIRRALKPTTPATAGRLLSPAAAWSSLVLRRFLIAPSGPVTHARHLQPQAILQVNRGVAQRGDVVVCTGQRFRSTNGNKTIGQLDSSERAGVGPGLGCVGHVRPCIAYAGVGGLPLDARGRSRASSIEIEVDRRFVIPIEANTRGFGIRLGNRLGQSDVALLHIADRQSRFRLQAILLKSYGARRAIHRRAWYTEPS